MIPINENFNIKSEAYSLSFARSSGPGGQNVNKVNSKALLSWDMRLSPELPGGVKRRFIEAFGNRISQDGIFLVQSESFRDQPQNVKACKDKLVTMIKSVWQPPKPRKKTKPTKASKERRLDAKKQRSHTKQNRKKVSF